MGKTGRNIRAKQWAKQDEIQCKRQYGIQYGIQGEKRANRAKLYRKFAVKKTRSKNVELRDYSVEKSAFFVCIVFATRIAFTYDQTYKRRNE